MKQLGIIYLCFGLAFASPAQMGLSPVKEVYMSGTSGAIVPKPKAPANLVISGISFSDANGNGNNMLDAGEAAEIRFKIENRGSGSAYNLAAVINETSGAKGITYNREKLLGNLEPGKEEEITLAVSADANIESGKAKLQILVKEGNHFDADAFDISFATQNFKKPVLVVADYQFTADQEGKIKLGQSVTLRLILQNQGQGEAKDVSIQFINPANVYPANENNFTLSKLQPNESRTIQYEFFANKKYAGAQIPIQVQISERYKNYGLDKTFTASLEQYLTKTQEVDIIAMNEKQAVIEPASLKSDVDRDIPLSSTTNENKYALIIGNEDYASYQAGLNTEANVDFAANDALVFREYCAKTCAVPAENIILKINATTGQMLQAIDKLNKLIKATGGKADVIVYYAGHGLPDERTKEPYLIPVDVSGSNLSAAVKLSYLYDKLSEFPSVKTCVFIDACFSGGARGQGLLAARGVKVIPANGFMKGNLVVFTASSGEQSSLPWAQKQHGMFTYFLLKKIKDSSGKATLSELAASVKTGVSLESIRANSKEQDPDVLFSEEVKNVWSNWRLD